MRYSACALSCIFFLLSCTGYPDKEDKSGEELSKAYCGSCHFFPKPELLDKKTWKEDVLPAMAKQLGIDHIFEAALPGREPAVTVDEWKKILAYYLSAAPDTMPAQIRPPVKAVTHLFSIKKAALLKENIPSTSYIKIDEGNHRIYAANSWDSSLAVFDSGLNLVSHTRVNAMVVHIDFTPSLATPGKRNGIFTNIGTMNPNDLKTGSADSFCIDPKGRLTFNRKMLDSIIRPVKITRSDIDGDGKQDYLVCSFGDQKGSLYWMKANDAGYEKKMLRDLPGAITAFIDDINHDGLPDIIALMAQADEGVFLFLNKGHGMFETKQLLRFAPVFGSSSLDLVDFNNDGYKDLLYTCGDNDDYSAKALKYYHGVYIYVNDGKNNFRQGFFFPLHGCYKAIAGDFDKDGDLDIAAISFFPDTKNQPQESFVYLQQVSPFHFVPFTIDAFNEGRWMTMDGGDLDGDGYEDIVLGSLIPPLPGKISEWKKNSGQRIPVLLLHNLGERLKEAIKK